MSDERPYELIRGDQCYERDDEDGPFVPSHEARKLWEQNLELAASHARLQAALRKAESAKAKAEAELDAMRALRDNWCEEYVKARDERDVLRKRLEDLGEDIRGN